jgi:phage shock protein PspC (stress-responsive transcriptional regulator)
MKRLVINEDNALICGVCSGVADYMYTNVTLVRCLFFGGAFFIHGIILLYILLWLLLPYKDDYYE